MGLLRTRILPLGALYVHVIRPEGLLRVRKSSTSEQNNEASERTRTRHLRIARLRLRPLGHDRHVDRQPCVR